MRFYRHSLFALLFLACSVWAAEPVNPDTVQARIQAEQGKKQAFADALWRYLGAERGRKQRLDEAADRLYDLAFKEYSASDKLPDTASVGLPPWQEALSPLRTLGLSPAAANSLKALEQIMKEAALALSAIPAVAADATPLQRVERQRALMTAASALGTLKQRAWSLDGQLEEEARRAASGARLLGTQTLMLPAAPKGEKQ